MKTIQRTACIALALGLGTLAQNVHATFLRGQPYTPPGADFTMTAVQGIDAAHPNGNSSFNPQINGDFEFKDSIGVTYDQGGGHTKDFGLGLYQDAAHNTVSTGIRVNYNELVSASSITITIEDFDIQAGHDTFFKTGKVEPSITLFGPGGTVFANLTPTAIFNNMTVNTTPGNPTDVWDLNFGKVLASMHIADGPISGF